jgi:DNA-binding response OmpR family regulator
MVKLIAIVDDEPDILELVHVNLEKAGYKTRTFKNAKAFLDFIKKKTPDLLILDLMLPDIDGIDLCKKLRQNDSYKDFPIIMLTAKDSEFDKVLGLELGADDYITKPFSVRELIARVKAVLRRSKGEKEKKVISIGNELIINVDNYEVALDGKNIELTNTEFNLLKYLAAEQGSVISREDILNRLWGNDKIVTSRTVDVHIRNLREKLGDHASLIKNVRGVGYKISN